MNQQQKNYKRIATLRNTRLFDFYDEAFPTQGIEEELHNAMEENHYTDIEVVEHLRGVR